mgnify:CR=1 FL=1
MNSKEEEHLVSSRWNDCSTMSIIHTPTEEERKKATDEMVDNVIGNVENFYSNKNEQKYKRLERLSERCFEGGKEASTENFSWSEEVQREIIKRLYRNWV